jgi:ABC-type antimicrobial peptide transport system permease subunit
VYRPIGRDEGYCILIASSHAEALLPELRREVASFASYGHVAEPQTLESQIDESIYQDRLLATVSGFFGALALLLAAVGLYGVVAYGAAQRSHEIGVRLALGAEPRGVLWMVLRGALWLVAMGLAIGLPAAFVAVRAAGAIVFGIRPQDPRLYAATTLALLAAAAAAAFLPACRAAAMDPMLALRNE